MAEAGDEMVMTIPLRRGWGGPRTERAPHAVKTIKRYVAQHMKREGMEVERAIDWREVWIDTPINEAIWARGRERPPKSIRVKAILFEDGAIRVELAGKAEDEDEEEEKPRGKGKRAAKAGRRAKKTEGEKEEKKPAAKKGTEENEKEAKGEAKPPARKDAKAEKAAEKPAEKGGKPTHENKA